MVKNRTDRAEVAASCRFHWVGLTIWDYLIR